MIIFRKFHARDTSLLHCNLAMRVFMYLILGPGHLQHRRLHFSKLPACKCHSASLCSLGSTCKFVCSGPVNRQQKRRKLMDVSHSVLVTSFRSLPCSGCNPMSSATTRNQLGTCLREDFRFCPDERLSTYTIKANFILLYL